MSGGKIFSFSWKIIVEPSNNEAKIILKNISHLSLWYKSSSGGIEELFIMFNRGFMIYQPNAAAILKIGKYIDTTNPPIITPKNTIINGSINDVRFSTA